MNEKRIDVVLPDSSQMSIATGKLHLTKAEAQSLLDQCQKIVAEPEQREWRDGDVVLDTGQPGNHYAIRFKDGKWAWSGPMEVVSTDAYSTERVNTGRAVYIGNLPDILASGPVVVGLTEEEAADENVTAINSRVGKVRDALAAYRQNKEKK